MDENRTEGNVTGVTVDIELSEAWKWSLIVILIILILVGTLGNFLTIYVIARYKELQTVTNAFIFNLAITDLCVSLFVDCFNVVGIADTGFFFRSPAVCEFVGSVCVTSCICSIMTMMLVSINRYYYVTNKPRHDELFTTRNLMILIMVLWLYSFSLFDLPLLIGWARHWYDYKTMGCTYDRTADFSFTLHLICVGIVIPVVVVVICYTRIYLFVRASNKRMAKHRQQSNMAPANKLKVDDLTLLRTLVIIGVVFFICWSQYVIVVLADFEDHWPMGVHMTALITAHSSSSTNCIILGVTNPKFREKYLLALKPGTGPASTAAPSCPGQHSVLRSRNSVRNATDHISMAMVDLQGTPENV
ncbi:melatonin receptor type 1A-like [Branchiostoma lanceolatum]|uniref:melatonin receptor type 1A-like n=1 Tax=Branchiostoma lanceolatum TaxID=7740 RepID=UPI0034558C64